MGNCQAAEAEAATVLIQHPGGGGTERAYWALSAETVMAANPGHYVAAVITTAQPDAGDGAASSAAAPVKHLKLLRPDDTLLLGRVYRLVSFEEVLREFASNKRQVKLSRVTVRAKDEDEDVKPASKHRRASGDVGERKESERSLAKVLRQTEELEPEADPSSGPSAKHRQADTDTPADLEALLPHRALLGHRAARQWRPALQSIAEGGG
ncbi:hypothetical protein ZEAMMB73_Zm00001d048162 [Zea mays]|uniref:DUF4228 domain protein n=2 Tax=Zea mays TaxID=4577 RepID=K7VGK4_MAIZE|nr:hypothetical protein ZEAMMB73_Zm00001d048162 [Zea mays]